jgi:VHS domain/GAT domain
MSSIVFFARKRRKKVSKAFGKFQSALENSTRQKKKKKSEKKKVDLKFSAKKKREYARVLHTAKLAKKMAFDLTQGVSMPQLIERATTDMLVAPDWTINIQICDICARDMNAARDAARLCKKKLKDKSTLSAQWALFLLEALMKNAYYVIPHVHQKEYLASLAKMAKDKKTKFQIRDKLVELLQSWGEGFRASAQFPNFFMTYQQLRRTGQLPFAEEGAAAEYTLPAVPSVAQRRRSASANGAQRGGGLSTRTTRTTTRQYYLDAYGQRRPIPSSSARRPSTGAAAPASRGTGRNAQTLNISKQLKEIETKSQLLAEVLTNIDPSESDIRRNEIVNELLPPCRALHKELQSWIAYGNIHESLLAKLLRLNDDLIAIDTTYEALCRGERPIELCAPIPSAPLVSFGNVDDFGSGSMSTSATTTTTTSTTSGGGSSSSRSERRDDDDDDDDDDDSDDAPISLTGGRRRKQTSSSSRRRGDGVEYHVGGDDVYQPNAHDDDYGSDDDDDSDGEFPMLAPPPGGQPSPLAVAASHSSALGNFISLETPPRDMSAAVVAPTAAVAAAVASSPTPSLLDSFASLHLTSPVQQSAQPAPFYAPPQQRQPSPLLVASAVAPAASPFTRQQQPSPTPFSAAVSPFSGSSSNNNMQPSFVQHPQPPFSGSNSNNMQPPFVQQPPQQQYNPFVHGATGIALAATQQPSLPSSIWDNNSTNDDDDDDDDDFAEIAARNTSGASLNPFQF